MANLFYFESHLSISSQCFHLNMTKTLIAIHCPPAARVSNYNFHTCSFCIHVSLVFPIDCIIVRKQMVTIFFHNIYCVFIPLSLFFSNSLIDYPCSELIQTMF